MDEFLAYTCLSSILYEEFQTFLNQIHIVSILLHSLYKVVLNIKSTIILYTFFSYFSIMDNGSTKLQ